MNMICHYHERVKVVSPEFGIAELDARTHDFGDARVFEPQRARRSAIKILIGSRKSLACRHCFLGARFLKDASWKGAVETPGQKDGVAFRQPVRQSAMVIRHGNMALARSPVQAQSGLVRMMGGRGTGNLACALSVTSDLHK
jgi:hypothetical protein